MIKKINYLLLGLMIFVCSCSFSANLSVAQSMTATQLVELLITIGAIPAGKAVAARAVVASLGQTAVSISASSTPYIQVLTPNGGESWEIDRDIPYSITWGTSSSIPVSISLTPVKGAPCYLSSGKILSKTTDNTLKVLPKTAKCYNLTTGTSTSLKDGTYRVMISYGEGKSEIKDISDGTFKILPIAIPSIKVTYPNGGEKLVRNTEYEVKYTLKNVTHSVRDLIYLYLLDSNGNIAFNSHKLMRNGVLDMELPNSLSAGAYKVKLKVTTSSQQEIEDTSDNFFWISTGL